MYKNENEKRNQNSASMLNQKTQEIFDSAITEPRSEKDTYTCPMHPEVKSDKPGKCPKCGMQLVKKN